MKAISVVSLVVCCLVIAGATTGIALYVTRRPVETDPSYQLTCLPSNDSAAVNRSIGLPEAVLKEPAPGYEMLSSLSDIPIYDTFFEDMERSGTDR